MSRTLARGGVFSLPLTVEKTVLTRCNTQTREAEELPEELEELLMAELSSRLAEDGQTLSCSFTVSEADGMTYATLRAECLESIGTPVPLSDGELAAIYAKIPTTEDTDT